MSYTKVYLISTTGELKEIAELSNSHGFAPFIWSVFCKKYFGDQMAWLNEEIVTKMCALAYDKNVPREWRAALLCTFDWAVVERSRFDEIATLLKCFMYSPDVLVGNYVCHIDSIRYLIEQHAKDVDAFGMCFYATSTSDNLWLDYNDDGDDETDEEIPYDFKIGTKHFFVGETLDKVDKVEKRKDCTTQTGDMCHYLRSGFIASTGLYYSCSIFYGTVLEVEGDKPQRCDLCLKNEEIANGKVIYG